jgi:AcrR family transcriptional regulator
VAATQRQQRQQPKENARARQLSQEEILDAARRLTHEVGVEQLTMRALADELGVSPMATYYYVESRDALLLLVADDVMSSVLPPPPESGTWDERLWEYVQSMVRALADYPGLSDFLLQHDATVETRRYMERCLDVLADGGFEPARAREAFMAIYTYMWGRSIFQNLQTRRVANGRRPSRRRSALPTIEEFASPESALVGYRALVAGLEQTLK